MWLWLQSGAHYGPNRHYFLKKYTHSGRLWGAYERFLRAWRGAPPSAKTLGISTFSARGGFGRRQEVPGSVRDGPWDPKSSRPVPKSSQSKMILAEIIPSSRLLDDPGEAIRSQPRPAERTGGRGLFINPRRGLAHIPARQ